MAFPNASARQATVNELARRGVTEDQYTIPPNGQHIRFHPQRVDSLERIFNVEFMVYESYKRPVKTVIRPAADFEDEVLLQHVSWASGLDEPNLHMTHLSGHYQPIVQHAEKEKRSVCSGLLTPACAASYYNIASNVVASGGGANISQGVVGMREEYYSPADLALGQAAYESPVFYDTFTTLYVAGASGPDTDPCNETGSWSYCGEGNLDTQTISETARNATNYFITLGTGVIYGDPFSQFLTAVQSNDNLPTVISMSYNSPEVNTQTTYLDEFNTLAAQLGLQGVTILVAAGDWGSTYTDALNCEFIPFFPSSSPYVTTVCATDGANDGLPETVASYLNNSLFTTGGVF